MFYHLNGIVTEMEPYLAVIDCGGVGYRVNTSAYTLSRLTPGKVFKLYTYCHIREECFDIYGFADRSEKRLFEMLIGVSGVGPKAALSILSAGTPESIAASIINEDERAITLAQGVGKKLASRVILELKDKVMKETAGVSFDAIPSLSSAGAQSSGKLSDAASALTVLGYSSGEISSALKGIDTQELNLEDIIRQALKQMMK